MTLKARASRTERAPILSEVILAAAAILMLLAAQWGLSATIQGSNYYGGDGKMVQATILAAFRYSRFFDVTNISPIEGLGSQMLTMNVWANPSFWPFAFLGRELAADISALVALGIFMTSCYLMARCFDVPVLPSAIAAQLCILLFAPALLIVLMPTNFCLTPGDAVVYAPYMIALGLLGRIEPGPWRRWAPITAGLFATLLYGFYADPMWASVNGFCWAVAFAVVTISPLRIKAILLRVSALACYGALFIFCGAAGYLETISQYTARVQYPALVDRQRSFALVSAVTGSPNMRIFYVACALGWLLGLVLSRGRQRALAAAAAVSFIAWIAYSTVYLLLLDAVWVPPIPLYFEHGLWALYMTAAVAGYWGVLQTAAGLTQRLVMALKRRSYADPSVGLAYQLFGISGKIESPFLRVLTVAIALGVATVVPAKVTDYALRDSDGNSEIYHLRWPSEPELVQYLEKNISSEPGQPFLGSIEFSVFGEETLSTMSNVWAHGLHTLNEYSQLVTPQATYFLYALLQRGTLGSLNSFVPRPDQTWEKLNRMMQMFGISLSYPAWEKLNRILKIFGMGFLDPTWEKFNRAMQMLGMRYYVASNGPVTGAEQPGYSPVLLPRRPDGKELGSWWVYEYPHPNVGDYSPTDITTVPSAEEIVKKISAPEFDFTKQVALSMPIYESLVPARDMLLSRIRGGFHISGTSDGTSLIVLPLQFSHCLRAVDSRVRFVRANLLMAGMVFTRDVDTEILFDYGIFSPGCRRADLLDFKRLDMRIDLRMPHLTGGRTFVDWDGAVARFREVGVAIGLATPEPPPDPTPNATDDEPTSAGPAITDETALADLPRTTVSDFAWIGIEGLNAKAKSEEEVVSGQPVLRLIAVQTDSRHYLAGRSSGLEKDRVYRVTASIKARAGVKVEMQLASGINSRDGQATNYGLARFGPGSQDIPSSSGGLKGRGTDQGPGEWQKVWADLPTTDGTIVVAFGLLKGDKDSYKGNGRLGVTFGGIEIALRK